MKDSALAFLVLVPLLACGSSSETGQATSSTEATEATEATSTDEQPAEPEGTVEPAAEPAATGCPAAMPVGHVECSTAGQTCPYERGECTCGDHDGNGTMFWACSELSTPTLDPTTGEPE